MECRKCLGVCHYRYKAPDGCPLVSLCSRCYDKYVICRDCGNNFFCEKHGIDGKLKSDKVLLQEKSKAFEQEKKKSEYQVLYEEMTEFSSKNGQMYYIYEGASLETETLIELLQKGFKINLEDGKLAIAWWSE